MKVKSENEVAQSYPTLSDPKDCSLPGSSVHGISQAGLLEWGAIAFSIYEFSYIFFGIYMYLNNVPYEVFISALTDIFKIICFS